MIAKKTFFLISVFFVLNSEQIYKFGFHHAAFLSDQKHAITCLKFMEIEILRLGIFF